MGSGARRVASPERAGKPSVDRRTGAGLNDPAAGEPADTGARFISGLAVPLPLRGDPGDGGASDDTDATLELLPDLTGRGGRDVVRDLDTAGRAGPAADALRIGVVGGELGDVGVGGASSCGIVRATKQRAMGRAASSGPDSGTVACSGRGCGCRPSPASVGARARP